MTLTQITGTAAPDSRRWLALVVLLTGTLLPPLDFFIVNVALPAIRAGLQASSDISQLVISVYAAAYAVTLILGGRLGDLYGRKRAFVGGMLGFGVASALCGLAPSPGMLIVGRLLQGNIGGDHGATIIGIDTRHLSGKREEPRAQSIWRDIWIGFRGRSIAGGRARFDQPVGAGLA